MSDQGVMTRKSLAAIIASGEHAEHGLAKALGPFSITAMGIGAIIGAGIFVLTGTAARRVRRPGHHALLRPRRHRLRLRRRSATPSSPRCCRSPGSAYTYTYATLGELFAWIIGWDLILEYAMGAATVAVGWSGYIVQPARAISASTCPPA